jgi:hypothetical protein
MTLLTIVQDAIAEIGGMAVPSYIAGNTDITAQKALRLVNRIGRDLQRQHKWPELKTTYTFTTVPGQAAYPLPTTWQRMSNSSHWDRTAHWPMNGPSTDSFWQVLQSGLVIAGMRFWFRMEGGNMVIAPTPVDARVIAFDYFESTWCSSAAGIPQKWLTADTDYPSFLPNNNAEDLMTLGLVYRLKASETLPFAEEKANYITAIDAEWFDACAQPMIDVTGNPRYVLGRGNIPEIGYGN